MFILFIFLDSIHIINSDAFAAPIIFMFIGCFPYYIIVFIFLTYVYINLNKVDGSFTNLIKKQLMEPFLSIFGDFIISSDGFFSVNELAEFGSFSLAKAKADDDYICGTYNNANIFLSETRLYHTVNIGHKTERTVTDFFGLVVKVELKKSLQNRLAGIAKILSKPSHLAFSNVAPVVEEDLSYNDELFDCIINIPNFTDNEIETHINNDNLDLFFVNLIREAFAGKLKRICESVSSSEIRFTIFSNNLYLFISNPKSNLFEVGSIDESLLGKETIKDFITQLYNCLSSILAFVDYLKELELV